MAEAFARRLGGDAVEAVSAGSRPSGVVNPRAVASLAALGYDLSPHASKSLAEIPPGPYDAAITMGCGDACPNVPANLREDWALPDPRHLEPREFDAVRDAIAGRVADLLGRLGVARAER